MAQEREGIHRRSLLLVQTVFSSLLTLHCGLWTEFIAVCGKLKLEVLELLRTKHQLPQDALDWVDEVVEYNCIGGKLNRGISVVHCTQAMAPGKELTSELKEKASVLGWCIEWLQAFFLVADDIMDESITRRGQPCWYRKPNVKMIAINDAFLLEAFVFQILKKHFRSEPYYLDLVETFHDVVFHTEIGQLLDLTSQPLDGEVDLDRFTVERYRQIVINKTAYYTFYLSAACAMFLNGVVDEASHNLAKKICVRIGEYFQIQDDFLDCYGDEKKLYNELELATVYHRYEDETYKTLSEEIAQVTIMPSEVFNLLVSKIFKRNK
ncbi:Peroxiredoxin-2 [Phytophthora nicotianae]|uniref:Peroxiredoxin-2 n=1 Tax=Phytophthora nicotianae TaxID=4792 RepID=A0A0W8CTS6_PHYNI|nr:Peroxiredoxin-2 [Phytophthora nicotianae]